MSRGRMRLPVTPEQQTAKKVSRLLTEDFSLDLEHLGYWLASEFPVIIFRRLEVVYLAAKDEYDRLMGEDVETEGYDGIFR